ncbi:MAG: DUF4905 domain-containing protein [Cyclobacteriaceae bacterium]
MPKKLIPTFTFTFPSPIWKTVTDTAAFRLFLELRDSAQHQVGFAGIDLTTGKLLWTDNAQATSSPAIDLGLTDSWWVTLHSASQRYLLLQSFTDTHNPEKKSYYIIDIASRQMIWQSEQFQVTELIDDGLIGHASDDETRRLTTIKLPDGSATENFAGQKKSEGRKKCVVQPFFYTENQPYFSTVAGFVESLQLGRPVSGCEYLEHSNYIVISYYLPDKTTEKNGLANYLLIIDRHGKVLLHECLEKSVPQPGLGTFFVAQRQLIVVQHQCQLVGYALP